MFIANVAVSDAFEDSKIEAVVAAAAVIFDEEFVREIIWFDEIFRASYFLALINFISMLTFVRSFFIVFVTLVCTWMFDFQSADRISDFK